MDILEIKYEDPNRSIFIKSADVISFKIVEYNVYGTDIGMILFQYCVDPPLYKYLKFRMDLQDKETNKFLTNIQV